MSETFQVKSTERGVIRIFTANLTADQVADFNDNADGATRALIKKALGVADLNAEFVELFALANLEGVGLAGYLTDGLGVAAQDVKPFASRLNAMSGHVLIVLSRAFDGAPATLTPTAPLIWIGTYTEEGEAVKFEPLPSDGAKGATDTAKTKPPKSDARVGGMIAMYALLAMFAFVGLIIWVGG